MSITSTPAATLPTTVPLPQAAYLARRAGFGAPPATLAVLSKRPLTSLVDYYVDYEKTPDISNIPAPVLTDKDDWNNLVTLQKWWLTRMLHSPRQLEEKMILFWHNHFATSNDKVSNATFMYGQNKLFRKYAMGDFQDLLTAITIDPAMLIWLDGDYSFKDGPNENYAREAMELFTIGPGNFTQADVRASARSLTGWYIDDKNQVQFSPDDHDNTAKTFLGHTGNWSYKAIARILANHPACGRFLAGKLWTFFAYDHPEPAVLDELAAVYVKSNRSIREVVRHMFSMPAFYGQRAQSGRVKGPVEHLVTAVREFNARVAVDDLYNFTWTMGQVLFMPPNVGGWPSGTRWINTATVVARFNFADFLIQQNNGSNNALNMNALLNLYKSSSWGGTLSLLAGFHLSPTISKTTWNALIRFAGAQPRTDRSAPYTMEGLLQLLMVAPEYYCA